jgi:glutamine---fructose-6-phosphate transaminase (isomerizing)
MLFKDICKQPEQLARSLSYMFGPGRRDLAAAGTVLRGGSPIVIAGIGASWHAGMAIQAQLLESGRPALLMDASELLHCAQVPHGANVVLLSRSGKSTEIIQLIEKCRAQSAKIIAITNQAGSPLAQGSDFVLYTNTDFDHAVSVSTYSAIAMAGALLACEARLLWEEASKSPATALTTGGFRHGPQEIVRAGFRAGIWIDAERMRSQDLDLARDLVRLGTRVLLIGQRIEQDAADCVLRLPAIPPRWQFLTEIIPIQLAAERLALLRGEDPDSFRLCSYIVENEGGLIQAAPQSAKESRS